MHLSDFDYVLPPELVAQEPAPNRDGSRLLLVDRVSDRFGHHTFSEVLNFLIPGDVLVLNNTRVIPARLYGRKGTGGKMEALLLGEDRDGNWQALLKIRGRPKEGDRLEFADGELSAELVGRHEAEGWLLRFEGSPDEFRERLEQHGNMPLPPYIKRKGEEDPRRSLDQERYQTVFARESGAIAAPTAGLHFTETLLESAKEMGVQVEYLTLHVGLGTFKPVTADDPTQHRMHAEFYELAPETASSLNRALAEGRRIIAVGTTAVRTLETCAQGGSISPGRGWTDIYIYPPYRFRAIGGMLTNFHLPKTTLLMLVSAFAGRERILRAYEEAVANCYRFFSYGDAMLML